MRSRPRRESSTKAREWRRLEGIRLLEKGWSQAAVARHFDVTREAVRMWWERYETGGIAKVKAQPRGGPQPRIPREVLSQELPRMLLAGPAAFGFTTDLWTLGRIAKVIKDVFGVQYDPAHVWVLLKAFGWSWQKPERQARERDKRKARAWLKRDWPRIKRGPLSAARPSFLPTRADLA